MSIVMQLKGTLWVLMTATLSVIAVALVLTYAVFAPFLSPIPSGWKTLELNSSAMEPTIRMGATIVYDETPFANLNVGDAIVFKEPNTGYLLVSRIVQISPEGIVARGYHNRASYLYNIAAAMYVGKVVWISNP